MTEPETDWFAPSPSVTSDGQAAARPDVLSKQVKLTVGAPVEALYQPLAAGEAGVMLAVMVGGVVSTSIFEMASEFALPALSVTDPETDWSAPSPSVTSEGHGWARPEVPSKQLKLTVGALVAALYQPLAAGEAGAMLAVIVGAVVSTSMSEIVAELLFPALSDTDPLTAWSAPSLSVTSEGHGWARPEVPSKQVKLTVGAPVAALYQPLAAGEGGAMLAVIVGGVVSTSMSEMPAEFELPALSVIEPETAWSAPSPSVTSDGQAAARPEVPSKQVKLTVGAPVAALYQPLAAGEAGVMLAVIVGAVASIRTLAVLLEPAAAPLLAGLAPSVAVHSMLWVPSPLTDVVALAFIVPSPVTPSSVRGDPPSVHDSDATFEGSVAVTMPTTGTSFALNQPLWPAGGDGKLTSTRGGSLSAGGAGSTTRMQTLPRVESVREPPDPAGFVIAVGRL